MSVAATQEPRYFTTVFAPAAWYCAAASTIAVLFSIAVSQILLGAAIVTLLVSRTKPRLPRIWLLLALFMAGTVLSLALSGNPIAGLPQIRKFYVYFTLLVVYSTVRSAEQARGLVLCWAAAGASGAAFGIAQFLHLVGEAHHHGTYEHYLYQRITGFMSHWQTYGGEQMIVLLMVAAFIMFSPGARRWRLWLGLLTVVLTGTAVLLGYTRGIWLGAACGALYLISVWRFRLLIAVPVVVALVLWLNPGFVGTRLQSAFELHNEADSNEHRIVCWRTGWEMMKAHPWLGLGPEMVGRKFMDYVPLDIPRPLPKGWYGHLHSIYIHYGAERGIPTMVALVAMLLTMMSDYRRALRRLDPGPSDVRFLLHGGVAVVLGIMVSGVFELNLGDSEVLAVFLAVTALGYIAFKHANHAQPRCHDELAAGRVGTRTKRRKGFKAKEGVPDGGDDALEQGLRRILGACSAPRAG